jgi:hypothetical protein
MQYKHFAACAAFRFRLKCFRSDATTQYARYLIVTVGHCTVLTSSINVAYLSHRHYTTLHYTTLRYATIRYELHTCFLHHTWALPSSQVLFSIRSLCVCVCVCICIYTCLISKLLLHLVLSVHYFSDTFYDVHTLQWTITLFPFLLLLLLLLAPQEFCPLKRVPRFGSQTEFLIFC